RFIPNRNPRSPSSTRVAMALPMTASIPLPDELLEEIFLRLPTLDTLACASATCTSFCRVIKGRAFRRRFRVLHRPSLLGFMDAAGFQPAQAPHPSAPLAAALGPCAADFTFVPAIVSSSSYILPEEEGPRWRPCDARDGRVLLDWISLQPRVVKNWSYSGKGSEVSILMDRRELVDFFDDGRRLAWTKRERCNAADFHLAICDPLSRRYVLLPTIPEDLAAQPHDRLWEFEPVLAPNTSDESEENHFKVICIARYLKKLVLFVIQSTTMQWCMVESPVLPCLDDMSYFDCVRGCFCWTQCWFWSDNLMLLWVGKEPLRCFVLLVNMGHLLSIIPLYRIVRMNGSLRRLYSYLGSIRSILFPQWVQPRDSCSSRALRLALSFRMLIATQWMSKLMKLPRSIQRWEISLIANVPSPTLASQGCYQNQLFDQLT
uniref:F-box domain-containing protein n=1 Tax=Aegilops tauschii subsp. strangulata TaxID=200361 RepID=A0A453TD19_AEGTS